MSCLGPSYNPNPTRTWFRFDNNLNDLVSSSEGPIAMLNKGNVLQYKKNSSRLTKQQKYAQIVRGKWGRKKHTHLKLKLPRFLILAVCN